MLVKHYRTKEEAMQNCGENQEVLMIGNANVRYYVQDKASNPEYVKSSFLAKQAQESELRKMSRQSY